MNVFVVRTRISRNVYTLLHIYTSKVQRLNIRYEIKAVKVVSTLKTGPGADLGPRVLKPGDMSLK